MGSNHLFFFYIRFRFFNDQDTNHTGNTIEVKDATRRIVLVLYICELFWSLGLNFIRTKRPDLVDVNCPSYDLSVT
jgi:hypothetical protein